MHTADITHRTRGEPIYFCQCDLYIGIGYILPTNREDICLLGVSVRPFLGAGLGNVHLLDYVHMGQFPKDGEKGQNVALFFIFWSSASTKLFDFFNFSQLF